MTEYFRLLAGLMSFEANLWLDHFCSSGPEGILESRTTDIASFYWKMNGGCPLRIARSFTGKAFGPFFRSLTMFSTGWLPRACGGRGNSFFSSPLKTHLPNHPTQLYLIRHGEVEERYHRV